MTWTADHYAPPVPQLRKLRTRTETYRTANAGITLEQIRIFVVVCERENMTLAAKELGLTQSGVSGAVSSLEERCGVALFDRVGRSIRLTDAGHVFFAEAQGILERVDAAEQALDEFKQVKRGTLQIMASNTVGSHWLPGCLIEHRRLYPKVRVQTTISNTANIVHAVLNGTAAIGFVDGDIAEPDLDDRIIAHDDLIVVVGPRHPWATKTSFDPADLLRGRWVLREPGSGTRSAFEAAVQGFGIAPESLNVALEIPSNRAICTAVEAGLGATALSSFVVRDSIAAGRLIAVPLTLPRRAFKMLTHRHRNLGLLASSFVEVAARAATCQPI